MFKSIFKNVSLRKFIFAFSITMMAVMVVAGGVYALIRVYMQPPDIPVFVEMELLTPDAPSSDEDSSPASASSQAPQNETGALVNAPAQEDRVVLERKPLFFTFLVFGIDDGNNADAIMVGSFDTERQEAHVISIPRDTRIDTDRRLRKAVAAYGAGRSGGGGHEGGVEQMKTDVQTLLGFRPDFYVSIDFRAFVRMIDSVGGVQVHVPIHMIYDDPFQNLHINIPAGTRTLDGRNALHFARFRLHNDRALSLTDYQRMANQQAIVSALFRELLSPRTILRVPELIRIYSEHVNTNLTMREKLWFADRLIGMDFSALTANALPIAYTRPQGWYEMPDRDAILELVNSTVNPFVQDITPEMVRIAE